MSLTEDSTLSIRATLGLIDALVIGFEREFENCTEFYSLVSSIKRSLTLFGIG